MRFACLCLSALCALTLPGCGGGSAGQSLAAPSGMFDWREIATSSDRTRLRPWRSAWMQGLAKAEEAAVTDDHIGLAVVGVLHDPFHAAELLAFDRK